MIRPDGGKAVATRRCACSKSAKLPIVAGPEVFDQNDTDMTAQLTKMKDAKVDFIIAYSLAPAGVQIAKSMQKIDLRVPWTSTWGFTAPNFFKLGGKDTVEGVMAVTSYTPNTAPTPRRCTPKSSRNTKIRAAISFRLRPRRPTTARA